LKASGASGRPLALFLLAMAERGIYSASMSVCSTTPVIAEALPIRMEKRNQFRAPSTPPALATTRSTATLPKPTLADFLRPESNVSANSLWVLAEVVVAFSKIPVNCAFGFRDRFINTPKPTPLPAPLAL